MDKKQRVFIMCLSPLYLSFILLDIFAPGLQGWSSALKYVSIWTCLLYASFVSYRARKWLLPAAMAFTVAADTGLLFSLPAATFVALFAVAQALHLLRMSNARCVCSMAAVALVFAIAAHLAYNDMLISVSAAYATFLMTNLIVAIKRRAQPGGLCAALGFALFVCCDICVALYNTLQPGYTAGKAIAALMWVFYLPSQALIIISSSVSAPR